VGETKSSFIAVNIEPTFYELVMNLVTKEHVSASAYCRRLIIKDLRERGLLTEEQMMKVLGAD
jgi:hypothetical protein